MAVFLDESGSDSVKSISNGSSCSSFSDFGISDESSKHGKHRKDDELSALSEVRNGIWSWKIGKINKNNIFVSG